ncbi:MAG: mycolipenoyl-CoA---2-(long-chain-fatty acyl)-trehalose mycolipenoyltransferase, partial [Streptomyces sp.]|nr:mycolipenoyl-CoA---2-(long-chain-fatty acyl)-trehalose mycolipenoyltransferase [Streptomyces sp.]
HLATAEREPGAGDLAGDLTGPGPDNPSADLPETSPEAGGHWLACAFDLPPGPVDISALRAVFEAWGRRHETLRSGFRTPTGPAGPAGPAGPTAPTDPERYVLPAEAYELLPCDSGHHAGPGELQDLLIQRLGTTCRPLNWPSSYFAVIVRPGGGTVLCGFDHCDADAYTLAIAVHELRQSYAALAAGNAPAQLPKAGSYVDYCAEEALAASEGLDRHPDARQLIAAWREFFTDCGGTAPSFPLPLGVPPGEREAQGTDSRRLLDPAAADAFEQRCRTADGSAFTGLLTAVALAARSLGGPDTVRLCTPLHTRHEERWTHAVGWFTTTAPVTVEISGVDTVTAGLAATRAAFRQARALAELPFAQVLPELGDTFRRTRDDVFMVSYIDYRRLPGADQHTAANAHHISSVTTADDAQFWFSRTHEGLFLRSRFPATPTAERTIHAFATALEHTLSA